MCFMKEVKSVQAARCIKSSIMTKVIDYVLSIDTFEQQCVVLKVMSQSPQLKDHVHTIGIDPSLSNNNIYEHKSLENIKNYTNELVSVTTRNNSKILLKVMLQSLGLKYHVHTIGIDQSLSNNALYEHKCLENNNKLYKQSGKCDNQQQFKDILEDNMVSTPG